MPRLARLHAPGHLVHVVSNFVNSEFRLLDDAGRAYYLRQLDRCLERTDWQLLAYALMSSHVHLACVAGAAPFWRLAKPLHTAVGGYLNRTQGRSGPVFAQRPFTEYSTAERATFLVRYLHNNPVRAGVCAEARESSWTSHRAYLGEAHDSESLDVSAGMALCGFAPSQAGRAHFNAHVVAHAAEPRDTLLSPEIVLERRSRVRRALGVAVKLGSPQIVDGKAVQAVLAPRESVARPAWDGGLAGVLDTVCARIGVSPDDARFSRAPKARRARRLFLWTAHRELGVSVTEAAAFVALSIQGGSHLLHRGPGRTECAAIAAEIAAELRVRQETTER